MFLAAGNDEQSRKVGIKAYSDRTPIQRVQNGQENCRVTRDLVQDIELFVGSGVVLRDRKKTRTRFAVASLW
jgi:hypothetical protein